MTKKDPITAKDSITQQPAKFQTQESPPSFSSEQTRDMVANAPSETVFDDPNHPGVGRVIQPSVPTETGRLAANDVRIDEQREARGLPRTEADRHILEDETLTDEQRRIQRERLGRDPLTAVGPDGPVVLEPADVEDLRSRAAFAKPRNEALCSEIGAKLGEAQRAISSAAELLDKWIHVELPTVPVSEGVVTPRAFTNQPVSDDALIRDATFRDPNRLPNR